MIMFSDILRGILLLCAAPLLGALIDCLEIHLDQLACGERHRNFLAPVYETLSHTRLRMSWTGSEGWYALFVLLCFLTVAGQVLQVSFAVTCALLAMTLLPVAFAALSGNSAYAPLGGYRMYFLFAAAFIYFLLLAATVEWLVHVGKPYIGPPVYRLPLFIPLLSCMILILDQQAPFDAGSLFFRFIQPGQQAMLRWGKWFRTSGLIGICSLLTGRLLSGVGLFLLVWGGAMVLRSAVARLSLRWFLRWAVPSGFVLICINLVSIYLFKTG